jgi:hypothetical protein
VKGPPALSGHCVDALGETREVDAPLLADFSSETRSFKERPNRSRRQTARVSCSRSSSRASIYRSIFYSRSILYSPVETGGRANSHRARLLGLNKTARRTKSEGGKETIGSDPGFETRRPR